MNIRNIKLKNFKCFEFVEVDFDDIPGLYQIKGNIGAGKTTIAEGILFAIYGSINGKKNGDLIRWGEKHGETDIIFTSKNHTIRIIREMNSYGQSPMSVYIDGEPMECPDKRFMQNILESEYLDVNKQVMELLCVISFNNFNSLSQMNTRTTRLFLDNVLGMDIITKYQEKSKEIALKYSDESTKNKIKIDALESEKSRNSGYVGEEYDKMIIEQNISSAKEKINDINKEKQKKIDLIQDNIHEFNVEKQKIISNKAEIIAIGKRLTQEIKFIEQGKCPTCGADIDCSHLDEKIKERETLRNTLKTIQQSEEGVNDKIKSQGDKILNIERESSEIIKQLNEYISTENKKLNTIHAQEEIKKFQNNRLEELENELIQLREKYNDAENQSSKYFELGNIIGTTIRTKIIEGFVPVINKHCQTLSDAIGIDFYPHFDPDFNCNIHKNNVEISRTSLSTGQGKIVDTIIILSILISIARHVNCNVMLLDELMSNLDNDTRSQLLFIIKQYMHDKTILIVSHQELDRSILDGMIKITRDINNNSSTMQIYKNEN